MPIKLRMKSIFSKLLTLYLGFTLSLGVNSDTECQELLNWIYKDLSVENLELSYERLIDKVLLGFIQVSQNLKGSRTSDAHYTEIKNKLIQIEPKLEKVIKEADIHFMLDSYDEDSTSSLVSRNSNLDLMSVLKSWKKLQDNSPDLFEGLDKKFQLDHWDMLTGKVLTKSIEFGDVENKYKNSLEELSQKINENKIKVLAGSRFNSRALKAKLNDSQKQLMEHFRKNFIAGTEKFSTLCKENEISKLALEDNYVCIKENKPSSNDFLNKMGLILTAKDQRGVPYFSHTKKPKLRNLNRENPHVNIHAPKYETNSSDKKATYCIRSEDLVSTIVIHHAASRMSPKRVNETHLNRGAPNDPWLMVGYNYLVEDELPLWRPGYKESDEARVYTGRPLRVQGAHAGGRTPPLTEDEKEFYKDKYVFCGNQHQGFEKKLVLDTLKENTLSGNLTSFGVSDLGDYSFGDRFEVVGGTHVPRAVTPYFSVESPTFENFAGPDYWDKKREKLTDIVRKLGALSCDIQKKYPNVKKIVPHQYFKDGQDGRSWTECPGYLINYLDSIAKEAEKLGCKFKVERRRE